MYAIKYTDVKNATHNQVIRLIIRLHAKRVTYFQAKIKDCAHTSCGQIR